MCTCSHLLKYKQALGALSIIAWTSFAVADPSEYDLALEKERNRQEAKHTTEKLASGIAGLSIGLYGYYNDDRGVLARVIYAATQTAGVLIIGEAIKEKNSKNLFLITNGYIERFEKEGVFSTEELKQEMARYRRHNEVAEQKKLAYTSGILSVLYFYNGYREGTENVTLQNIYFFLGANAALISAANFYKAYLSVPSPSRQTTMSIDPFPGISVTARW